MSLFRRRRATEAAQRPVRDVPDVRDEDQRDEDEPDGLADDAEVGPVEDGPDPELDEPVARGGDIGPYDVTEAPDDEVERLDLGSLKIPAVAGVEVRMQANEQGEVGAVVLVVGENALQVGAFAAPRSEGIWPEIRAELRDGIRAEGGTVTEQRGEYGRELRARVKTPEGPADVRFVGVDGPRWFVRALFQGEVALDPAAAQPLVECLHGMVVDRGRDAMPVRDALPLRLPPQVVQQQPPSEDTTP